MDTVTRKSLIYHTGIGGTGAYAATHVVGCSHGCRFPCYAFLMMQRFGKVATYEEWCRPQLVANALQRYGFTSQEIIRGADGAFEVRIASRSRSGNWLPTGGIERYALMLRLYDTPVGVATRTQRDAPMPSIATVGCP